MNHGDPIILTAEDWVDAFQTDWFEDDPDMWTGLSGPIETGGCECEALCTCEE